jgi:hypothetical protein
LTPARIRFKARMVFSFGSNELVFIGFNAPFSGGRIGLPISSPVRFSPFAFL